jgi:hypothetical protein
LLNNNSTASLHNLLDAPQTTPATIHQSDNSTQQAAHRHQTYRTGLQRHSIEAQRHARHYLRQQSICKTTYTKIFPIQLQHSQTPTQLEQAHAPHACPQNIHRHNQPCPLLQNTFT